jgi:uncharacterized protein YcbK (DUF882 family)
MTSRYFTSDEMKCQHCGAENWDQEFMEWLDVVRHAYGKPMVVTSGYRCPEHPIEKKKSKPGAHSTGRAVDIKVGGADAIKLIEIASSMGCKRIGVNQNVFVHLDRDDSKPSALWTY